MTTPAATEQTREERSEVTATVQDGRIDESGLEHLRAQVGIQRQFRPWNSTATADAIWHFALGVGDDNPLWQDRDYARSTAWGGVIAPPTFLSSCSTGGAPPGVTT